LIDHLHRTRRDLRRLTDAIGEQPDDVRQAIVSAIQKRTEGEF
jgi:hypothetical protein